MSMLYLIIAFPGADLSLPLTKFPFYRTISSDKVENKFQPLFNQADFLAAIAATENHGTYDHPFSWPFCALK